MRSVFRARVCVAIEPATDLATFVTVSKECQSFHERLLKQRVPRSASLQLVRIPNPRDSRNLLTRNYNSNVQEGCMRCKIARKKEESASTSQSAVCLPLARTCVCVWDAHTHLCESPPHPLTPLFLSFLLTNKVIS